MEVYDVPRLADSIGWCVVLAVVASIVASRLKDDQVIKEVRAYGNRSERIVAVARCLGCRVRRCGKLTVESRGSSRIPSHGHVDALIDDFVGPRGDAAGDDTAPGHGVILLLG